MGANYLIFVTFYISTFYKVFSKQNAVKGRVVLWMKNGFVFRRYLLEPRVATVSFPSLSHSNNIELIRWFSVPSHIILFLLHFCALFFGFCLESLSLSFPSALPTHFIFIYLFIYLLIYLSTYLF